jgi:hypothetical protein
LFYNHKASSRTIDFEVSQGNICITSCPFSINPNFSSRDIDWECTIPLVPDLPVYFTINIRDVPEEDKMAGLKRSQSMKSMKKTFRSFGDRLFNKETIYNIESTKYSMKHSDSVTSFNSISSLGFQSKQISSANKIVQLNIGQFTICGVKDWTKSIMGEIGSRNLEFYKTEWDQNKKTLFSKSSEIKLLGKLNLEAIFLESQDIYGTDLLPLCFSDYKNDLSTIGLHKKVWKEGFLYQKGGDCDVYFN